jgi:hypothetical protein
VFTISKYLCCLQYLINPILLRADLHCANALSQPLRFPDINHSWTGGSTKTKPAGDMSRLLNDLGSRNFIPRIDSIMQPLYFLCVTIQQVGTNYPDNIWYSDQVYNLQRRLLDLPETGLLLDPMDAMTALTKAVAIAALLFSYPALRDISFNYRSIGVQVTNLQTALALFFSFPESEDWGQQIGSDRDNHQQSLFWTLAVGAIAADGKAEQGWFRSQFAMMCRSLGVESWEEVKEWLNSVLWVEELESAGKRLCKECLLLLHRG